jgi:adenine phosphoribosyltransferase
MYMSEKKRGDTVDLKTAIRNVPDFPKPGIQFKDITTVWKDPKAFRASIDLLRERYDGRGIDKVVGAEARGFIVGSPRAYLLGAGFVPVRKKGKLPAEQIEVTYDLEYGTDTLTMHRDAISRGEKVLVVDDLLATGGTLGAIVTLCEKLGGEIVEAAVLVELAFLNGRSGIEVPIHALVRFDEE